MCKYILWIIRTIYSAKKIIPDQIKHLYNYVVVFQCKNMAAILKKIKFCLYLQNHVFPAVHNYENNRYFSFKMSKNILIII